MTRQEAYDYSDKNFCCNAFVIGYDEGFSFGKQSSSIECAEQMAKQAETIEKLRGVLGWYASEENYKHGSLVTTVDVDKKEVCIGKGIPVRKDYGARAREALK